MAEEQRRNREENEEPVRGELPEVDVEEVVTEESAAEESEAASEMEDLSSGEPLDDALLENGAFAENMPEEISGELPTEESSAGETAAEESEAASEMEELSSGEPLDDALLENGAFAENMPEEIFGELPTEEPPAGESAAEESEAASEMEDLSSGEPLIEAFSAEDEADDLSPDGGGSDDPREMEAETFRFDVPGTGAEAPVPEELPAEEPLENQFSWSAYFASDAGPDDDWASVFGALPNAEDAKKALNEDVLSEEAPGEEAPAAEPSGEETPDEAAPDGEPPIGEIPTEGAAAAAIAAATAAEADPGQEASAETPVMEDIYSGRHPEDSIQEIGETRMYTRSEVDFRLDAIDFDGAYYDHQPGAASEQETKKKIKKARRETRREERYRRKVRARNKTRWVRALAGVLSAVAVSLLLAWVVMMGVRDIIGIEEAEYLTAELTVEDGMSANDIADILGEKDVISYPWLFKLLVRLQGIGDTFQPGVHELTPHEAYADIVRELQTVPARTDIVRVTFPEGFNFVEVARRLEENGVCGADEFIEAANSSRYEFPFIRDVGKSDLKFYKMEGYLFPDSYEFFENDKPENAARTFFENFQEKIAQYSGLMAERGMTMEETITLASLIQCEAASVEEMPMISSVFHNRLDHAEEFPYLQSDPTYKYVDEVIKPNIKRDNQAMYDAYDTRVCEGLPVGPIANPGDDAIRAALNPAASNYYFFVHNTETGECFFAETYAEHQENCRNLGITGV